MYTLYKNMTHLIVSITRMYRTHRICKIIDMYTHWGYKTHGAQGGNTNMASILGTHGTNLKNTTHGADRGYKTHGDYSGYRTNLDMSL